MGVKHRHEYRWVPHRDAWACTLCGKVRKAEPGRLLELLSQSPIARRKDPESSHEAARALTESGTRAGQQREVLDLVRRHPGRTSLELAGYTRKLDRYQIARRLAELREGGLVEQGPVVTCTASGRKAVVWDPVLP